MTAYIILRVSGDGYAPRGPVAQPMDLEAAKNEVKALKQKFPLLDHVIFKEHAKAVRSERITVRLIDAPQRRVRKASDDGKVVPIKSKEVGK